MASKANGSNFSNLLSNSFAKKINEDPREKCYF
jgi:hypothetical protein